jgi:hypothetical protein
MNTLHNLTWKRTAAGIGAATLVAVPATLALSSSPAAADVERHGACGNATYEFQVDREAGGFEVSADVEHATPGSRWRVVLRHDGHRFFRDVLRADHEGDLDVERWRRNTAGDDVFTMKLTRLATDRTCTAKIRVS